MKRRVAVAVSAALVLVFSLVTVAPAAPSGQTTATTDSSSAIVQLIGDPLSIDPKTKPPHGKKVDFSSAVTKSERAKLSAIRNDFKRWLQANAPKAQVTSEMDVAVHAVAVKLNGTTLTKIRTAPMVRFAELQGIFRTDAHDDPDLSLVHANEAWAAVGGAGAAGSGVKVAVIDSGIDASHPCFNDAGYPTQVRLGQLSLTNNKVIVAKVFHNQIKKFGLTAAAVDSHGTHVAGTIACNAHTPASIAGVDIPYDPSGVAPRALLGNYNVFPGDQAEARSEDILNALDEAYEDGMDVANLSLGGARNDGGGAFLLDNAINNLDEANMVVAVAAGNEGPGYFTVHYPGAAPRALTAGASTVGHSIVNLITVDGTDYVAVVGGFEPITSDLTAPLAVVSDPASGFPHNLNLACDDSPALPDLTGEIALLGRGTCDFTVKVRNAQNAGAVGVVMVNRVPGEAPFTMSHNDLEAKPTIPAVMVSLEDGAAIDDHDGAATTLHALGEYLTTPEDTNLMAGFSSWGPTHGDLLIKPDVVAPGADVISSFPHQFCDPLPVEGCWAMIGGTSMATPHLAGAAAVVRQAHPTWSAAEIRSAIVNTAQQGVLRHPETGVVTFDAQIVGAGLLDVQAAVGAVAGLNPVSTSFGNISSGAGSSRSASVTITNISGVTRTFSVSVEDVSSDGVTFAGSGTFTLAPGASATFQVTAVSTKGVADGHKQATLRVSASGAEVAHAMLYVLVGEGDRAPGQHQLPPPKA